MIPGRDEHQLVAAVVKHRHAFGPGALGEDAEIGTALAQRRHYLDAGAFFQGDADAGMGA